MNSVVGLYYLLILRKDAVVVAEECVARRRVWGCGLHTDAVSCTELI